MDEDTPLPDGDSASHSKSAAAAGERGDSGATDGKDEIPTAVVAAPLSSGEEDSSADQADTVAESSERFALFATGGPLIVEVQIRINGEDHHAGLARLVELALAAADVDGDGQPTWDEVTNSDRFRYGQFGNLEFDSDDQREQIVRMYDRNQDGNADPDEMPRFITRNAGFARTFSLRSSNEYRSESRGNSPLRRLLDSDGSGAISDSEVQLATSRLLRLDDDDDEILTPREVAQEPMSMARQLSNMRRQNQPDTAVLIDDRINWKAVHYVLSELYSYEADIQAADWPATPQLFLELDHDEDGTLTPDEIERMADAPAHIVLAIEFGDGEAEAAEPTIEFLSLHADVESQIVSSHHHPRRCSIELAGTELEFFVNEDPALAGTQEQGEQQLKMLDADENGYLDEDEFPANFRGSRVPFAAVDQDGDGMLYLEELTEFFDLRQAAFRGQIRARSADQPDTLFTALDTDGDGLLKSREIYHAATRLRQLDRDADQQLHGYEIPGSMVVGFVRGNPQSDDFLQVVSTTVKADPTENDETPAWFRGMDANGDGEISSREFLGDDSQFADFDLNRDGFLSIRECTTDI